MLFPSFSALHTDCSDQYFAYFAVLLCSDNPDICTTLVFYAYPSKPGWTRFYGTSWVTDSKDEPIKSFSLFANAMPPWIKHVLG